SLNPFNSAVEGAITLTPNVHGAGVPGGIITFGQRRRALFERQVIRRLRIRGDSSCVDHATAYRMAGFGTIPKGVGPGNSYNSDYAPVCQAGARPSRHGIRNIA